MDFRWLLIALQMVWTYGYRFVMNRNYLIYPKFTTRLLQGSGSEGRPESPSDSLDGTKKGERKKEFVCQVGLPLTYFTFLNLKKRHHLCNIDMFSKFQMFLVSHTSQLTSLVLLITMSFSDLLFWSQNVSILSYILICVFIFPADVWAGWRGLGALWRPVLWDVSPPLSGPVAQTWREASVSGVQHRLEVDTMSREQRLVT